jgi:hemoglobin
MKPDITGKKEIQEVMQLFYEKANADKMIGKFFTRVVKVNWENHIPVMTAFWENVLFYSGDYEGNPLEAHNNETIDQHFSGSNATKMKQHASEMAAIMLQQLL